MYNSGNMEKDLFFAKTLGESIFLEPTVLPDVIENRLYDADGFGLTDGGGMKLVLSDV